MTKPTKPRKSKPKATKTPGSIIIAALDKHSMNTAALAKASRLSSSFLSLVISGKRQLAPADILKVSTVLKVKPSDLLTTKQRDDLKALQDVAGA